MDLASKEIVNALKAVGKHVTGWQTDDGHVLVTALSKARAAACPGCACWSNRIHDRSVRRLAERPCLNLAVTIELQVHITVPREKLYCCWTEPVRPGGASLVVMRGPDGQEIPNPAVYLEVVPNERLVATDPYTRAWEPSAKPFMTLILTFDDLGGGTTRYTARARHWSEADRESHEKMGFQDGWARATDQLAELAARL